MKMNLTLNRAAAALGCLMAALAAIMMPGCIKNDLPYPKIPQNILKLSAEGESAPAKIDSTNYTATIYLNEDVDVYAVKFDEFDYTPGATADPNLLEGTYNLSVPMVVTLTRYQKYQWVIKAEQEIERRFAVEGEIGTSVIDPIGRRIIVTVPEKADAASLTLTDIKLGPAGITTMVPDLRPGPIDLSKPLRVAVTVHGRTEDWAIYCEKSAMLVDTSGVDAWSRVMWAYGAGPADVKGGFRYRKKGDEEWTTVPESAVTQEGGSFSACIPHLEPLTEYEVCAYAGEHTGTIVTVETQATEVLPDGSFDQWWLNKKVWCPWNEGGLQFWDTGNTGASMLGESNVQPSDNVPPGLEGKSAKLETRFVGVIGIGKLAAGSIFTGKFKSVDGTNGILDFGQPWTVRPTKLRGYYNYTTGIIDYGKDEMASLKGRPDTCAIYIALADWTAPYEIRTNPKNRQLFDPQSPSIIAYGELYRGDNTDGWEEFEIELAYRSTSRVPTYIQITCAASKYGDYFAGSTGSTLFVDQFTLDYDY